MNICMFTNTYLPHVGGVARSVASYAEDLRKMGHRVLIIAPTFAEEVEGEREEEVLRVPAIQNFNGSDFSMRIAVPFLIANIVVTVILFLFPWLSLILPRLMMG